MDKDASVIAKLKNKAKASGKPFQLYLQLFCQEEFLRRLSLSRYAENLILKGGLFIYTLTNFESRATIDVDFLLRQLPSEISEMQKIIEEILSVETGYDFITFEAKGYEKISPQHKDNGISFQLIGKIKNTQTPFNVDIGIGDVIVPKAEKRKIPTQLEDFTVPEITTYSIESTIAEKLDAILGRLELTSRMKDFYDIYYLANTFNYDGRKLQEAIVQTLENRGTVYEKYSFELVVELQNDKDMQQKWRYFLRSMKAEEPDFSEVITDIEVFLHPLWDAIINEEEWLKRWDGGQQCWW
ncbi:MAG: nucleotidyl transferase AbiEii/AbiGii toxin family protein [Bellilinea sp.]